MCVCVHAHAHARAYVRIAKCALYFSCTFNLIACSALCNGVVLKSRRFLCHHQKVCLPKFVVGVSLHISSATFLITSFPKCWYLNKVKQRILFTE